MVDIKLNKIPVWNETVVLEAIQKPTEANEEIKIPYDEADNKLVLIISNSGNAATATVKTGEMPMSGSEDTVLTIPANKSVAIALESGKYKKKDGCVHIIASATTLGFQLIAMP